MQLKNIMDTTSYIAILSAWAELLSPILTVFATLLAAIWSAIRLYEWWKHKKNPNHE